MRVQHLPLPWLKAVGASQLVRVGWQGLRVERDLRAALVQRPSDGGMGLHRARPEGEDGEGEGGKTAHGCSPGRPILLARQDAAPATNDL